jgi:hypothetical protein
MEDQSMGSFFTYRQDYVEGLESQLAEVRRVLSQIAEAHIDVPTAYAAAIQMRKAIRQLPIWEGSSHSGDVKP